MGFCKAEEEAEKTNIQLHKSSHSMIHFLKEGPDLLEKKSRKSYDLEMLK